MFVRVLSGAEEKPRGVIKGVHGVEGIYAVEVIKLQAIIKRNFN